ncbi:reticulophagy regulator 3-like [Clytia hemisphaerica]|uniref:RETREG1-3/ARL6IP-like N-terminal reticulon-homology domain-containing protein n=1 Tax=Clytia hemisphaerica TaxID=252671 RepID=A0A7M5WTX5_9CNID|eukprot:TCONS_00070784-protein
MFKRLISWLRSHGTSTSEESELDQKKNFIKNKIQEIGVTWKDIENVFFWNSPWLSFTIYGGFLCIFWKFISYELQRIGLLILLFTGLIIFQELRKLIYSYLEERSFIKIIPENKSLGFSLEDVVCVAAETWLTTEAHFMYLMQLKERKDITLCFYLAVYLGAFGIIIGYIPVSEILFLLGTFLYFYPVCSYLGIIEKLFERLERIIQPIALQWCNTETKRTRNKKFDNVVPQRKSTADAEEDEFLPRDHSQPTETRQEIMETTDDSMDEFDLRGKLHLKERRRFSDFDEDSFLPYSSQNEFPSMSQFDSMMEPLDDEFHAGLDFQNVTARSNNDFGIPDSYLHNEKNNGNNDTLRLDDTDEDIKDLPIEETDGSSTRFANIARQESPQHESNIGFEFVDKEDLHDVTDEEINEQNAGQGQKGIVSNMLGY